MEKRGQVSIFVIIAILIVAIVILVYSFVGRSDSSNMNVDEVKTYAQDCLKQVSEQAVLSVGEQGGYYNLPNESLYFPPYLVAYYIYGSQRLVPSKNVVEEEIAAYIDENLNDCFSDFNILEGSEMNLVSDRVESVVQIKNREIDITAKINLVVTRGNSSARISDISTIVGSVHFPHFLDFANEIADEQTLDTRAVCVNCLSEKAREYNLSIEVIKTDARKDYVYLVKDPLSNFSSNFTFNFGAHYEFPICNDVEKCASMLS